jgi:hypothetical protein
VNFGKTKVTKQVGEVGVGNCKKQYGLSNGKVNAAEENVDV